MPQLQILHLASLSDGGASDGRAVRGLLCAFRAHARYPEILRVRIPAPRAYLHGCGNPSSSRQDDAAGSVSGTSI